MHGIMGLPMCTLMQTSDLLVIYRDCSHCSYVDTDYKMRVGNDYHQP